MSLKRNTIILAVILLSVTSVSFYWNTKNNKQNPAPVELNHLLNLTDDKAVENQIVAYIMSQDNETSVVSLLDSESVEKDFNVSITLQGITNKTDVSRVRYFNASYVHNSNPDLQTRFAGSIDELRKINEFYRLVVNTSVQDTLNIHEDRSEPDIILQNNNTIHVVSKTVEASNRFAFDLYEQLRETSNNIFFSPYSISTAFSMVYEGARGTTAEETQNVFHLNTNTSQRLTENKELYESINNQSGCELDTANALWIQTGYPVLENFSGKLKEYYQAEAGEMNLAGDPEGSREVVNAWVENRTKNKINELFPEGSFDMGTRLVLANAIYFKGDWLYQFNPEETELKPFKVSESLTVNTDMMRLRDKELNYTETDELQILKLPYSNSSISLIIILPKNKTISEMEQNLNYEQLKTLISGLRERSINVYLPSFKTENTLSLVDILSEMGMPSMFSDADLTGINPDRGLYIDKAIHKAVVEVNEQGSEAAAATGIAVALSARISETFNADHPFIYIIQDDLTGQILFMGRLNDPTQ